MSYLVQTSFVKKFNLGFAENIFVNHSNNLVIHRMNVCINKQHPRKSENGHISVRQILCLLFRLQDGVYICVKKAQTLIHKEVWCMRPYHVVYLGYSYCILLVLIYQLPKIKVVNIITQLNMHPIFFRIKIKFCPYMQIKWEIRG